LLTGCATKYTKVESPVYKNRCYDFTLPEGDWSAVSDPLTVDILDTACIDEPTIFDYSTEKYSYSIILDYVNRKTKKLDKNKIFKELDDTFDTQTYKYENYEYITEDIKYRDKDCYKVYLESIVPGDFKWYYKGRRFQSKLADSEKVLRQAVIVYCLFPSSNTWMAYNIVFNMSYERFSIDLEPDPNFEKEAMEFFNSLELTFLQNKYYEQKQDNIN